MPVIRSISGLRATLGDSLSPSLISDYTVAFSSMLPQGVIVIGRDGRPSGKWIEQIVIAALRACGRTVHVLGVVPTPTVQLMTEHSDAVGGIAITASHNPSPWNGMKFIGADGVFLDAQQNKRLWAMLDSHDSILSSDQQAGEVVHIENAIDIHINKVLSMPLFTDEALQTIQRKNISVVVDAVNCSGSIAIPKLLDALGVEVKRLYCNESGIFPHIPEPLTENLSDLIRTVESENANIGVAIDPDADRLVLIGKGGIPIGEEKTVMLAIEAIMRNKQLFSSGTIPTCVVNLSTSRMADDAAMRNGGTCSRAAVGEINVVRQMQAVGAIVGGEGSGGVIVPSCHYGRDSLVGVALVIWLIAHCSDEEWEQLTIHQQYTILKHKQTMNNSAQLTNVLDSVISEFSDARAIDKRDGIRCDWDTKWVQVRGSNTEPIVRVIAEAPTEHEAQELIERVKKYLP